MGGPHRLLWLQQVKRSLVEVSKCQEQSTQKDMKEVRQGLCSRPAKEDIRVPSNLLHLRRRRRAFGRRSWQSSEQLKQEHMAIGSVDVWIAQEPDEARHAAALRLGLRP